MTPSDTKPFLPEQKSSRFYKWLDYLWVALLVILVAYSLDVYRSARYCAFLGTDFRGYYASAQIARQRGFAEVYNPQTQEQYQAALPHSCPDGSSAPPQLFVYMPYLPVFGLIFLPLTFLDFTNAYILWVTLNLTTLLVYLARITHALGDKKRFVRILQWALCLPIFSNLVLGQINILLLICVGEFGLAAVKERHFLSGTWLGGFLMKPHILILLLPGLIMRKNWVALLGFTCSAAVILLASTLLAGWEGVLSAVRLATQFLGALIQTGATMTNFRALALNLVTILPAWFAWSVAIIGIALVVGITLYLWTRRFPLSSVGFITLIVASLAATFAVTWHSHFYLLALLIPFLLILDLKQAIPPAWRWVWIAGPPLYYVLLYLLNPQQARNLFGLGMLALNLCLLAWATWKLNKLARHPERD
ncbi:MAG: glycosyltransferase family 87 protein [Anaerolineales bacterium]